MSKYKEEEIQKILEKLRNIQNSLVNNKEILKVSELAFLASMLYRYPKSRSYRNEFVYDALPYFLGKDHTFKSEYYFFEDSEVVEDKELNQDIEKLLNAYINLIIETCNTVIRFAFNLYEGKSETKKTFEKYLLASNSLSIYSIPEILRGLMNPVSHDAYMQDINMMNIIANYLNSGIVDTNSLESLNGYRDLYPNNKIRIYNQIKEIAKSQTKYQI